MFEREGMYFLIDLVLRKGRSRKWKGLNLSMQGNEILCVGPLEFVVMADPTSDQSSKVQRNMIRLWSADKVEFEVDREVACEFQALRHMVQERRYEDPPVHLHRIPSRLLGKILKYCEYHVSSRRRGEAGENAAEVFLEAQNAWETEYIKVDRSTLFALLEVSSEWNIEGLVSLTLSEIVKQIYDGAKKLIAEEEADCYESELTDKG